MDDLHKRLQDLKERFEKINRGFDREVLRGEISELESQTMENGFWNDRENATKVSQELADKQRTLETLESLEKRINEALEMTSDQSMAQEISSEANQIDQLMKDFELKLFLSGPHDKDDAIVSVHSGTGGVEAMDWAGMLVRMYQRFLEP